MNQKDETNALLPEWLAEHASSIEQLNQSETDLGEFLDDDTCLTKVIRNLEQEMIREGGRISMHGKGVTA